MSAAACETVLSLPCCSICMLCRVVLQLIGQLKAVQWVWRAHVDDGALNCEGLGCGVVQCSKHDPGVVLKVI